jgi:hypothetical protein
VVPDTRILVDGALVNKSSLARDGFGWWLRTLRLLNLTDREFRSFLQDHDSQIDKLDLGVQAESEGFLISSLKKF